MSPKNGLVYLTNKMTKNPGHCLTLASNKVLDHEKLASRGQWNIVMLDRINKTCIQDRQKEH